jgi:hypothetical protein
LVGRSSAYTIGSPLGCGNATPIALPEGYAAKAEAAAAVQLERASARLGTILNRVLADVEVGTTGSPIR